jgi:hypothetical protein
VKVGFCRQLMKMKALWLSAILIVVALAAAASPAQAKVPVAPQQSEFHCALPSWIVSDPRNPINLVCQIAVQQACL